MKHPCRPSGNRKSRTAEAQPSPHPFLGGGQGVTGAFGDGRVMGMQIETLFPITTSLRTQLGYALNVICHHLVVFAKTGTSRADSFKMHLFVPGARQGAVLISGQLTP